VQDVLKKSPYCGHMFVFRGKRADRIKILWWDGTGLCLYAKRLERGRFVWPLTREGAAVLTPAQLSYRSAPMRREKFQRAPAEWMII
jgi:transposase